MMVLMLENTTNVTFNDDVESYERTTESTQSVFDMVEEMWGYKLSIHIFTYATVPVAIWGWIGNFLSFR